MIILFHKYQVLFPFLDFAVSFSLLKLRSGKSVQRCGDMRLHTLSEWPPGDLKILGMVIVVLADC